MAFLKDLGCRICQLSGESKATPYLFRHLSSLHVRSCAARELGNGHFEFLLLCYVLNPPLPVKFCSLLLSLISSSSISSNINFIHIHTWSLYIRSLAFECFNIALVTLYNSHAGIGIFFARRLICMDPTSLPTPHMVEAQ